MVKIKELIDEIGLAAKAKGLLWVFIKEGGNHSLYKLDGLLIPIPRKNEISNLKAEQIKKECEPKLGRRWWR